MNLLELRTRLRRTVKNPEVTDISDPMLTEYINDGYRDLAARYPYHQTRKRETFVTISGENKYALPCDCSALLRVSDTTTGKKLLKIGDRRLIDRKDTFRGRVKAYERYRNYIQLVPTPGDIYTVELFYIALPCDLVNDNDKPILPKSWHSGIWMRAKWYYFMDMGDTAQATAAQNAYALWLADKPSEIEEESVDIDLSVELPELSRRSSFGAGRFDDGSFDFYD